MANFIQILNTILPVILLLAVGILCRSFGILTRAGIDALKKTAVNISLPAVLLGAFASMQYTWKNVVITLTMFLVCLAAFFLGKGFQRLFHMKSRFVPFLCTGFEAGMLGYALFTLLYGTEHIGSFATIDLGQVLFVFTAYKLLLAADAPVEASGEAGAQRINVKTLLRDMFTSPVVIAMAIGVLLGATGIYTMLQPSGIAGVLDSCTNFIGAPTSVLILISIGYDLVFDKIPWNKLASVLVVRVVIMLVMRIAAGAVLRMIGLGDSLDTALNVMMILPAPFVLPVFADDVNEREYVSATLSVMTGLSIVGFMLLAIFV